MLLLQSGWLFSLDSVISFLDVFFGRACILVQPSGYSPERICEENRIDNYAEQLLLNMIDYNSTGKTVPTS